MATDTSELVLQRVDDQIRWYGDASERNKRWHFGLKLVGLGAAAALPVLSVMPAASTVIAGLGALILVLEGVQQLFQYQQSWMSFRSTAEDLKHEKYLFIASGGPYQTAKRPVGLLAERAEARIARESQRWVQIQSEVSQRQPPTN
jgi:hypothetical protein